MTQLDIFSALNTAATAAQPPAADGGLASRPEPPHDHAGQPGDDGTLHWMLTGQPEPRPA